MYYIKDMGFVIFAKEKNRKEDVLFNNTQQINYGIIYYPLFMGYSQSQLNGGGGRGLLPNNSESTF